MKRLPNLMITSGDPAGIGLDLCVMLAFKKFMANITNSLIENLLFNERRQKDLSSESLRQRVKEKLIKQRTEIRFKDWVKTLREGAHVEIWLYED